MPRRCVVLNRPCTILIQLALMMLAGCGYKAIAPTPKNLAIFTSLSTNSGDSHPIRTNTIDTNCTGCNSTDASGRPVDRFVSTFRNGGSAPVSWSVSGGDSISGPGSINSDGQYTPPSYLTEDIARVVVTASLQSDATVSSSTTIRVTPGFLRPLTPENAATGVSGSVSITGYLAEAGGSTGISYSLAGSETGLGGGSGTLREPTCKHESGTFTSCTVTYSAPPTIAATGITYVVATVGSSSARMATRILLNTAGISSDPGAHQAQMASPIQLGASGGNNSDYDLARNQIVDCCSGTLGALLKGSDNKQYLLSNNHVLARSDHAAVGDAIVQPGLIDNNCAPGPQYPGTTPVASLTAWLPLDAKATNADAAIAEVRSNAFDPSGSIQEMGLRQSDGTLGAAPPGTSSTGGKGENGTLQMKVAKSGRTTGQTCAAITAIDVDVNVDYFLDCAETKPYVSKTYTHQLVISGDGFSDAGDSGALVLDVENAEPVGLYFAGGIDASGVSQAVANPAPDLLTELSTQNGSGTSYSFVGTQDHPVSCLNYGDGTVDAAQALSLSDAETMHGQQAAAEARILVNPAVGILGVAAGKSSDRPGEAAVTIYVDGAMNARVPISVSGVRTIVTSNNGRAADFGTTEPAISLFGAPPLPLITLNSAVAIKQQFAPALMKSTPAFFAVGVGQSLDNPREAALVVYVDRRIMPAKLPQSIGGLRTRYVVMDRFHVTRSYAEPTPTRMHCMPHREQKASPISDFFQRRGFRGFAF
jgi:hypothetical protein